MIYKKLLTKQNRNQITKMEHYSCSSFLRFAKEEAEIKLTAHLVGTREWKPYNKAKYIEELIETGHSWEEN